MVTHKSPIYSTMSLVLTLFSVAVLFVLLGAPFLGALQVLVYAGAIVVLFLFVIMLLNVQKEETAHVGRGAAALDGDRWARWSSSACSGWLFWRAGLRRRRLPAAHRRSWSSLKALAAALFADYLLPFEIVGLLLLVAVIGATVAARRPPAAGRADDARRAPASRAPISRKEADDDAVPISWYLLLVGGAVRHRRHRRADPAQRHQHLPVDRADAQRGQPDAGRLRAPARASTPAR